MKKFILIACILLVFGMVVMGGAKNAKANVHYKVTDFYSLVGEEYDGYYFRTNSINDYGQIAGELQTPDGDKHCFLYSNGILKDLGTLGGKQSWGAKINNLGQVIGVSYTSDNLIHSFLYSNGIMTDLGTLGGDYTIAQDINDFGQITGTSNLSQGYSHSFLYKDGIMTDLGTLGGMSSGGESINNYGQIFGYSLTPSNDYQRLFVYSEGKMETLIELEAWAQVQSANDIGQAVGLFDVGGGYTHAFLYYDGVLTDLSTLGGIYSEAIDINDLGQIVGVSRLSTEILVPFVYLNGKMMNLYDLLSPNSLDVKLSSATSINNNGQILAGHYILNPIGNVPEPATMLLLGFGLIGLAGVRRKIKK